MITGDERELLAKTLAQAAETAAGGEAGALDASLLEIGWQDALALDARTAVSLLFEAQGRTRTASGALDAVLAHALDADASDGVAVVLPAVGGLEPPARPTTGGFEVRGLLTGAGAERSVAWVACSRAPAALTEASTVAVAVDALDARPVQGLDPDLGLVEVTGVATGEPVDAPEGSWGEALAAGRRALAHELVGASRTMLEQAREHALERIQFGQPIARFQAVRHRLAEALVAAEAADAAADAAWDDGSTLAATAAKAIAGRSARTVARHAQQVLAGIGFTTEHPLQGYVRRVLVLDGLLGDSKSLTRAIGEELLRSRDVPPLLPL